MRRHAEKIKLGNCIGGKLELIGLNYLFKININIFEFLAQEKPQLVVENNFADKQITIKYE